ncbi:hypothetical protein CN984_11900 [Bacillus cereus]|uniref:Uncharacterized protein n=1 Tax=Bacillus cereus TaxID=1396 RepID=A0A2B9Q2Q2_BACCE|nr:hypothetical protein [Bacillus cereus]PEA25872.1 hypothetical protein CON44_18195 [Bacillus cereus]PGO29148.1 hypothetical protein CN984_11900 [Bacillus cereus]
MKGVIQLTVEVDYNQMITEDKLEALHAYTGKSTEDALRQHHFEQLCKGIVATVENRPFTQFDIQGSFVPNEIPQEDIVVEDKDDTGTKIDIEVVQEHINKMNESSRENKAIELLDEDIEKISMTRGMPTQIKVNEVMKHALENKIGVSVNSATENRLVESYQGFPVAVEGMEELYIIEYKEYVTSEIQQKHRTAEELN